MRYAIYGAGAIGGVLGARIYQAGHDVALRIAVREDLPPGELSIDELFGAVRS